MIQFLNFFTLTFMRKKILSISMVIVTMFLTQSLLYAQGSADYGAGIKLNVNPEGTKYVRLLTWSQIWMRSIENNPGTMVNGVSQKNTFDIGARRLRMLAYAQINPRFLVLAHWGINNQTFVNGGAAGTSGTGGYGAGKKPGIFFHDFWSEYTIVPTVDPVSKKNNKFSMNIGAGLHYVLGLSRMTMSSTLNYLTIDSPIFSWATIENSDQFAREFGLFAKGKAGKLEYRLSLNKPYATNLTPTTNVAVDNNGASKLSKSGYFEYQFLDQESNLLPFKVGTYLATTKVFNIGAGFYTQPEATQSLNGTTVRKHNISLMAVDAFLDLPFGKKESNMAVTAYAGYYKYDFGPNYLRNLAIMNVGTTDPSFTGAKALAGPGNAQPMIGTGSVFYLQSGILLPKSTDKPKLRVQPFGAFSYKNFEALKKSHTTFDIGTNLLLDGHHSKITLQYSTRPVYTAVDKIDSNKGQLLIQFMTYL